MKQQIFTAYLVTVAFVDTMALLPVFSPYAASLGVGAVYLGVILSSYSLTNMIGNLPAGPLIDRFGRRAGIVCGLVVAGGAVAAYAVARAPWQLLLARIVHGLGGAVLIPAVFAHLGDRSRAGAVGKSMGFAGAWVALAAMVGPALGGIVGGRLGASTLFVLLGLLLLATAPAAWVVLGRQPHAASRADVTPVTPLVGTEDRTASSGAAIAGESASRPASHPAWQPRQAAWRRVAAVVRAPRLAFAYRAVFGLTFAMSTLAYRLPFTLREAGLRTAHVGIYMSGFALSAMAIFLLPTNRLSDRFGRVRIAQLGAVAVGGALATLGATGSASGAAVAMVSYGVGFGLLFTALSALMVDHSSYGDRGTAFGVFYAVFSLGAVVGPVGTGLALRAGLNPYWIAAAVALTAASIPPSGAQRPRV